MTRTPRQLHESIRTASRDIYEGKATPELRKLADILGQFGFKYEVNPSGDRLRVRKSGFKFQKEISIPTHTTSRLRGMFSGFAEALPDSTFRLSGITLTTAKTLGLYDGPGDATRVTVKVPNILGTNYASMRSQLIGAIDRVIEEEEKKGRPESEVEQAGRPIIVALERLRELIWKSEKSYELEAGKDPAMNRWQSGFADTGELPQSMRQNSRSARKGTLTLGRSLGTRRLSKEALAIEEAEDRLLEEKYRK